MNPVKSFDHLSTTQFARINKGYDQMLLFPNCTESGGYIHDLEGAEVTRKLVNRTTGEVIHEQTKTFGTNQSAVSYDLTADITEGLDSGIYKVIIDYVKKGRRQQFVCCSYVIKEC